MSTTGQKRRRWTPEECDLLRVFVERGLAHKEIADRLNRSKNAVSIKAHEIGATRSNHAWTDKERAKFAWLVDSGKLYREIAEVFGVSEAAAISQAHVMRLPLRHRSWDGTMERRAR